MGSGSGPVLSIEMLEAVYDRCVAGWPGNLLGYPIGDEKSVTDEMVESALDELNHWTDHVLLVLPKMLDGNPNWDRFVMRRILEAAIDGTVSWKKVRVKDEERFKKA